MTKTTLIFDLDGTIIHSAPDLANALNYVFGIYGCEPLSVAEVQAMMGNGMPKLLERALAARAIVLSEGEFQQLFLSFRQVYSENCCTDTELYPGAVEMLEQVRREGYLTAICTNKLETITLHILKQMQLEHLFDGVVGAEPPRPRKPDADPVYLAIERAGGQRNNAIMIGDSPADIGAGKAAGLPTVAVSFGYTNVAPDQLGAGVLVDHLDQVSAAVNNLN
jgi:phosphoglycolate phosphatase